MRGTLPLICLFLLPVAGCTDTGATEQTQPGAAQKPADKVVSAAEKPESQAQEPAPPPDKPVAKAAAEQTPPIPDPATEQTQAMRSIDELLLFFPTKFPDGDWEPDGLNFQDVWFESEDETKLHGWYCPCENPRAFVLFAHGNAGNLSHRAWLASYLVERLQVSVMMFDYRGYGRSEGTPTAEGILQDGRAAGAKLAELAGVQESDVVLMGRSLGGAVVVPLAVEIRARGLILQSTFSSLKDVAAVHFPKLAWLVSADKLNSAAVISDYQGALLQSHGDLDRTVQYESGRKLFAAANEPKQFVTIPGGDHNDSQTREYYGTLEMFIEGLPGE